MDIDVDIADTVVPRNVKSIIFEVEMYGDTICPWCYLGKKSVDRAIETYASKHPEDVFDIIWKPFILWPTAKVSGESIWSGYLCLFFNDNSPASQARYFVDLPVL